MVKSRGRPKQHPVDSLRTRIWFQSILLASGFTSAYQVEMFFDSDMVRKRDHDVARPRKWDSYQKGSVIPSDKLGDRNSIEQAEVVFNGTAKWFRSPLWAVLKGKKLSRNQIEDELKSLGNEITDLLFEQDRIDENSLRIRAVDDEVLFKLYSLITFESFVAIILLIQYSELISSAKLRERALFFYEHSQKVLKQIPCIESFYEDLIHYCDLVCKYWTFVSPSQRLDIVIFSKSRNG